MIETVERPSIASRAYSLPAAASEPSTVFGLSRRASFPIYGPSPRRRVVLDELDALEIPSRGAVALFPLRVDIGDDLWWVREIQNPGRADDDPGDGSSEDEIEIIQEGPAVESSSANGMRHLAARRASHILCLDTKLFTPEDARTIQTKIDEIKAEIARTPDKTSRRQLRQLKIALVHALDTYRQAQHRPDEGGPSAIDTVRRAGVGIAGGTLIAAGVVFAAVPVIPGWIFAYAGGSILATEFEGAKEIVEQVKVPMAKMLADDDAGGGNKPKQTTEGRGDEWEKMIGVRQASRSDLDSDFAAMMRPRPDETERERKPTEMEAIFGDLSGQYDEGSRKVRQFLKTALKLEDVDINGRDSSTFR